MRRFPILLVMTIGATVMPGAQGLWNAPTGKDFPLAGGTLGIGLDLPWGSIGLAALLGIGLSMVAAWYPARLASRLAIVRAVQHE